MTFKEQIKAEMMSAQFFEALDPPPSYEPSNALEDWIADRLDTLTASIPPTETEALGDKWEELGTTIVYRDMHYFDYVFWHAELTAHRAKYENNPSQK